jgi:hypothetical protein
VVPAVLVVVVGDPRLRSTQMAIVSATKKDTPMTPRVSTNGNGHIFLLSVSLSSGFLQQHTNNIECELRKFIETMISLEKYFS